MQKKAKLKIKVQGKNDKKVDKEQLKNELDIVTFVKYKISSNYLKIIAEFIFTRGVNLSFAERLTFYPFQAL